MLTNWLLSLGLTRDSWVWFWGRLTSGALLIVSGLVPLEEHMPAKAATGLRLGAVLVLWLAGKYDSSPLPGRRD